MRKNWLGFVFVSVLLATGVGSIGVADPVSSVVALTGAQSVATHRSAESALGQTGNLGEGYLPAPLVPIGKPEASELPALTAAVAAYGRGGDPLQTEPLEQFVAHHPDSPYRASLWLNIGLAHEYAGDYPTAIAALNRSLSVAGNTGSLGYSQRNAEIDQTLTQLLVLQTGFGNASQVALLLANPHTTVDGGIMTAPMLTARRSLWMMRHIPQDTFLCGAVALEQVLIAESPKAKGLAKIGLLKSKQGGLTLADLQQAAASVNSPMRVIQVAPGGAIPVPSVMHWTLNHYVAIIGKKNGRYVIDDPAFNRQFMMSRTILDRNGSGFYLVPAKLGLAPGWELASATEENSIKGGGIVGTTDPTRTDPYTPCCQSCGSCGPNDAGSATADTGGGASALAGMPQYSIATMLASLRITDNPVGYNPPIGPSAEFQLVYNQQDASLSASGLTAPIYGNLGPQWTDNWLSYIVDDPNNPGSNVSLVLPRGGYVSYSGYSGGSTGSFTPEEVHGTVLTRVSATEYMRVFSDGSKDIYAAPNSSTSYPRLIYVTKIIDKFGNALSFGYDNNQRLTSVTDAIGQVTTLQYDNSAYPLLLTSVTDPFGRKITIGYDSTGRLNALTDAMGMQSTFTYSSNGVLPNTFINSMTTPYGTTSFTATLGTTSNPFPYWMVATDPLGNAERVEYEQQWGYPSYSDEYAPTLTNGAAPFNEYLNSRNSYYWDKATYALITDKSTLGTGSYNVSDYEKAVVYHWQHINSDIGMGSGVVESMLYPLERNLSTEDDTSRVWYAHPNDGQGGYTAFTGSLDLPSQIARVLPNQTTQLTQLSYSTQGNVTSTIDPIGRQTNYTYASNGIDLTQAAQVDSGSSGGSDILGTYTYNTQHEPLTAIDAAGNKTAYTYNSAGQVLTVTDPLNETTTYTYTGPTGPGTGNFLTKITDANGQTKDTYTYDSIGRIATWTDSQGYMLSYSYDNLDRLTKITYPDSTTTQYQYTNLDITKVTDRLGRATSYAYDANRNLNSVTDPLGRTVQYGYDPDGRLTSLTDADGQTTTWTRDIEGRVTKKTFADGNTTSYKYDISGRLTSRTDALGQTASYTYATDNRVTKISYSNPVNPTAAVTLAWDGVYPRLDSMTDGTGKTKFAYVAAGDNGALQLSSETGPSGAPAKYAYAYDELGRLEKLTVAGTAQDTTTYDAIGRDITDTTPLGAFDTAYLGETNQVNTVTALGQSISGSSGLTTYGYLANTGDRRLNTITFNANTASDETITTDDAFRVTGRTDGTGKVESYTYDNADRLSIGTVTAPTAYTETYGLNNADFLSSKSGELTTSNNWSATNPGSLNQIGSLTPSGGTGRSYTYDADGNVLSDGVNNYTWDAENRLLSITNISTGHVSSFTYDGLGRRVAITETSGGTATTTGYLWCGTTLCSAYNSGGATTARYLPWGEVRYSGSTATDYYYERDHLGSVVSTSSTTGAALGTLATDAYGLTLSSSGTLPSFGYAGMFLHQPSGLYLTMFRAYDPYSGRWLSRDPAGEFIGGINLYAFEDENPVNHIDPYGEQGIPGAIAGALLGAIGGGAQSAIQSIGECKSPSLANILAEAAVGAAAGAWEGYGGEEVQVGLFAINAAASFTGGALAGAFGGAVGSNNCSCRS